MLSSSYNPTNQGQQKRQDTVLLEKQVSYYFNSAESAGAVKIGTLGNIFEIQLNNPIQIPRDAIECTLEVPESSIWNTSPNISAEIGNNLLTFTQGATPYSITIPDGLYGVEDLNSTFRIFFQDNGLNDDQFIFTGNDSTQSVILSFNYLATTITFGAGTCYDVLGWNLNDFLGTSIAPLPDNFSAPNVAAFNRVVSYFIKTSLISAGIPQNVNATGIIARIPIDVAVGSLINYAPRNPVRCDASELIGNSRQSFIFRLVDQLERDTSTNNEEWALTVILRYWVRM
jgi:hypothetical protein